METDKSGGSTEAVPAIKNAKAHNYRKIDCLQNKSIQVWKNSSEDGNSNRSFLLTSVTRVTETASTVCFCFCLVFSSFVECYIIQICYMCRIELKNGRTALYCYCTCTTKLWTESQLKLLLQK